MIIGLSGKIGCGKTYLAKKFVKKFPEYKRISFGDLLKEECSQIYGYPLEWNYGEDGKNRLVSSDKLPKDPMTVREVLQWHGTDLMRARDPNYWVDRMKESMKKEASENYYYDFIIDDVRFGNEAEFVKSKNGVLIRIRPYPEWKPGPNAEHISETALDKYFGFNLVISPEYGKLEEYVSDIHCFASRHEYFNRGEKND